MSKKIWIAGLIAVALLVTAASVAVAASGDEHPGNPPRPNAGEQSGDRPHRPPQAKGEIISIGDDEFTMLIRLEVEITVLVDEDTKYLGDLESFADLEVGMQIGAAGKREGEGTFLAKALFAGERLGDLSRAGGEVTDVGNSSLTIETRDGETLTFEVNDQTRFKSRDGEVQELSDIEEGDMVLVIYLENDSGDLVAKAIGVGGPKGDGDRPHPGGEDQG